jgi:hypothetical protein
MVGAVSRGRPWLGVTYVRAVLSGFNLLVKYTSSAVLEIHIGQVMVWSSHIEYGTW